MSRFVQKAMISPTAIGQSGGGLSIKSITFTDRPTAWEWLKSNYQKAIKATMDASIVPVTLVYNTVNAVYDTSTNELSEIYLTAFYPKEITDSEIQYRNIYLKITETETSVIAGTNALFIANTPSVTLDGQTPTTLPDSYWSTLSGSLTVYYIG